MGRFSLRLLAFRRPVWYHTGGAAGRSGRPSWEGTFLPSDHTKGGLPMVTYADMFSYSLVIIGIIGLFIAANKKK